MRGVGMLLAAASLPAASPQPSGTGVCVSPGVCEPPPAKFTRVLPIKPRQQWNIAGGFCGSTSMQVMMMGYGAWVSEDLVRKANIGGPCFGHGDSENGCEVGPENYNVTATGLRLDFDVWDYTQPKPQAAAFKTWIKSHLVKGAPVMWVPICKGDKHTPYGPRSCPGGGHFDHHEPIIGIGSNHNLSDANVYEDDWLLHFSDQDLQTYYRAFSTLEDDVEMQGNCKNAQAEAGKNEMYPCFYSQVTYGLAVRGIRIPAGTLRVSLDVDRQEEPDVRAGDKTVQLKGTVTVYGLEVGKSYILYRYNGTAALPSSDLEQGQPIKTRFMAAHGTWTYMDPLGFLSSGATYYVAAPADFVAIIV